MKLESKEKFSFLQLAHYLARIDNKFGEREEDVEDLKTNNNKKRSRMKIGF